MTKVIGKHFFIDPYSVHGSLTIILNIVDSCDEAYLDPGHNMGPVEVKVKNLEESDIVENLLSEYSFKFTASDIYR